MDELELLQKIQHIHYKLNNDVQLNDDEYKIFALMLLSYALNIAKTTINFINNIEKENK